MRLPNRFLSFVILIVILLPLLPAILGAQTKSTNSKSSGSKTSSASGSQTKARSAPKAKAPARRRAATRRAPSAPAAQSRPTKDRYLEIQKALADAGYDPGPANGTWGDSSVKALQQFQQDQGIDPSGKIDALTLIRLDLGPKYDSPEDIDDDNAGDVAEASQGRATAPARSVITSTN